MSLRENLEDLRDRAQVASQQYTGLDARIAGDIAQICEYDLARLAAIEHRLERQAERYRKLESGFEAVLSQVLPAKKKRGAK